MNISDCAGAQYHETRRCLFDHSTMYVEGAVARGRARCRTQEALTAEPQVVIPLSGAFIWHLGSSQSLLTANHALFIGGGAVSHDTLVDDRRIECLLLTPHLEALQELAGDTFDIGAGVPRAASRVVNVPARLQHAASAFWNLARRDAGIEETEEAAFELMDVIVGTVADPAARSRTAESTLVGQVKELIGAGRERLSLTSIATQLRASPAYLTNLFRRSEGITIAHYHRRLRLSRALIELPHANDITALALELGFSSHAHFTTAFRATYGETPSAYRARMR